MELPLEQQALRAKCIHPSGRFVEFPKEDVELSIPVRFEKLAARYGHRTAVKMGDRSLTYQDLNQAGIAWRTRSWHNAERSKNPSPY